MASPDTTELPGPWDEFLGWLETVHYDAVAKASTILMHPATVQMIGEQALIDAGWTIEYLTDDTGTTALLTRKVT